MVYKEWRKEKGTVSDSFLGFRSNRFGRTAYLATLFVKHKVDLQNFFDETVDEHSNKLVLALSMYLKSEWFTLGCEVYSVFQKIIITPLCELLGIDEFSTVVRPDRNWVGIKDFFHTKLIELNSLIIPVGTVTSAKEKLISRCATKVVENVERQLSAIVFFQHDHQMDSEVLEKMKFTPLTNSACESRMAQLDVKIKVTGGSAPVQTISDKQVVSVNKYLLKDECSNPQTI